MSEKIEGIVANRNKVSEPLPLALWGLTLLGVGFVIFSTVAILNIPLRLIFGETPLLRDVTWWAGAPVVVGFLLVLTDIVFLSKLRRRGHTLSDEPINTSQVTVVLTAYNDEESIGEAVLDFTQHPQVKRVIVIDNASKDATSEVASAAGAIVHLETSPGYGHCVHRALTEGSKFEDTPVVVLCEGDMTFRASDISKLSSYIAHGDVVNGTRIVEQLRSPVTQLTNFMFWGNFAGAKLLEFKHLGRGTITDLGTTYKMCRSSFLREHLAEFDPRVNLEFNAHFLDTILGNGHKLVEAPVTFHPRVGLSKGGNVSDARAIKVGLRMFTGIFFSWKLVKS